MSEEALNYGAALARYSLGVSREESLKMAGQVKVTETDDFRRALLTKVASLYEELGREDLESYYLIKRAATCEGNERGREVIADSVIDKLGEQVKVAAANLLGVLTIDALLSGASKVGPGMVSALAGGGIMLGGGAGALLWKLKREANENSEDTDKERVRLARYNKLLEDMDTDLKGERYG